MNTTTRNLMFLLGAAPMGMGGCLSEAADPFTSLTTLDTLTTAANDDETGESGGDGDGDAGDGDGDSGDGDGDTTGDGDGDTTGDGDGDTGDGDGDTGDGDGDGDTTGDGDGDGDPNQACVDYSENIGVCFGPQYVAEALMYCEGYLADGEMYGPDCVAALEVFYVCLSNVTCDQLMMEDICFLQQMAVSDAC